MNIEIIRPNISSQKDITIYRTGTSSISAMLVKKMNIENKNISLGLDKDDDDHRFLYLTIAGPDNGLYSIKLEKKKSGSFTFSASSLRVLIPKGKSVVHFRYYKKIQVGGRPYLQFERIEEGK